VRDKIYLITFLLLAALLIFLGHDLLQRSVLFTWVLTFGGTSAVSVLTLLLYQKGKLATTSSHRQLHTRLFSTLFSFLVSPIRPVKTWNCSHVLAGGLCWSAQRPAATQAGFPLFSISFSIPRCSGCSCPIPRRKPALATSGATYSTGLASITLTSASFSISMACLLEGLPLC
jgi:hypothetical protein